MIRKLLAAIYFLSGSLYGQQHCVTPPYGLPTHFPPAGEKMQSGAYIIPVVFHVFHEDGSENISDAQILDQLDILNREFNRNMPDTALTPAAFKSLAAGLSIEFRLATKDPQGNCTNGINRKFTPAWVCGHPEMMKASTLWPTDKYLNIWIGGNALLFNNPVSCAYYYYSPLPWMTDLIHGVYIHHNAIGTIGTSSASGLFHKGRTLVHEVAHYLDLRHIWGDTPCGDDYVADTPPAEAMNTGCPAFPYKANNTCGSDTLGEMFMNYMDYTNGSCQNLFTTGQVARMQAALSSTVGSRNKLHTTANLQATGVEDPYTYPVLCPPVPEIAPFSPVIICAGDSVTFTDRSYGGVSSNRMWNFFGQPCTSATDSIVRVHYPVAGTFDVQLSEQSGSTTKSRLFPGLVVVLDKTPKPVNSVLHESFENDSVIEHEWRVVNADADSAWYHCATTSFTGNKCLGFSNFFSMPRLRDEIISPAYDLSAFSTATISFRVHFARCGPQSKDQLILHISSSCGKTWKPVYSKTATTLPTTNVTYTQSHTPARSSPEWREDVVVLNADWNNNPVFLKFLMTSQLGNNVFIDDLNIKGTASSTGMENEQVSLVQVYPNPVSDRLRVVHREAVPGFVVQLVDVYGRVIHLGGGSGPSVDYDVSHITEGVYQVIILSQGTVTGSRRMIKIAL